MKIATKFVGSSAALVGAIALISGGTTLWSNHIEFQALEKQTHAARRIYLAAKAQKELYGKILELKDQYLFAQTGVVPKTENHQEQFEQTLNELRSLGLTSEIQPIYQRLPLYERLEENLIESLQQPAVSDSGAAIIDLQHDFRAIKGFRRDTDFFLSRIEHKAREEANQAKSELLEAQKIAEIVSYLAIVLLILMVAGISWVVLKPVLQSLKELQAGATEIGAGNLTYQIDIRTDDEIAQFSQTFNQMAQNLNQAQRVLEQQLKELQRATRLKDEFLATMSHELRTPLNAILGMTEGLQEAMFGTVNDEQLKALDTIAKSGFHLLSLINDILDLSKILAGKLELDVIPVSIEELCYSSITFIKPQSIQKEIQLTTILLPNPMFITADARRIRQVLINLLDNAVKFTPRGGQVTLKVALDHSPTLGNCLIFSVIDTGIGIASENLEKLFLPFTQVDGRLNRQYEGTGLGLALVKQIVELHGGQVQVKSQLNVGSCFQVFLPYVNSHFYSPEKPETMERLQASLPGNYSGGDSSQAKILLAEDNEATIATFSSYLLSKNYDLIIAKNGIEAISLALSESPQLILMDIQMPEMDGLGAIAHLRQHSALANIPIIALTALAMEGDREKCLAVGASDYISKPVKLKQLDNMIQAWLSQACTGVQGH